MAAPLSHRHGAAGYAVLQAARNQVERLSIRKMVTSFVMEPGGLWFQPPYPVRQQNGEQQDG